MKTYGVVLIGCGYMGSLHLDEISKNHQAKIVGVVDLDEAKARQFAETYHADSYHKDYRSYLTRSDVHIVIIATYASTHLELTKACLAAGKHVICEKPICGRLDEAQEFVRIAKKATTKVILGHILRHNPTYRKVAEMIQGGAIGGPIVMRMSQLKRVRSNWSSYISLLQDASPIVDCGVHYMDVMRWVTGADVTCISGVGQRLEQDVPAGTYNYGMSTVKLTDGSIGYYEAGWGHTIGNDNLKEFIGPKGRIRIVYQVHRKLEEQHLGNVIQYEKWPENTYEEINIGHSLKPTGAQFAYFLRMIEDDLDPKPFLDDAYRALQITLMADQAIQDGQTIYVSDVYKKVKWNSI